MTGGSRHGRMSRQDREDKGIYLTDGVEDGSWSSRGRGVRGGGFLTALRGKGKDFVV